MSEILQEPLTAFVEAKPVPAAPSLRGIKPGRVIKITLALALLGGSAGAVLQGQGYVTADNAVVSAYVLSVRTPILGQVSGLQLRVGDPVAGAGALAVVSNDRVSDERLVELRTELARQRAEQAALARQLGTLRSMRQRLATRADDYRLVQAEYASALSHETVAQLPAHEARLDMARRTMVRKAALGRTGDAPVATVEQAALDARALEAEFATQSARLLSVRMREAAAHRGMFLDNGSNDVSYSAQRIDEVDLRITEAERASAVLDAGIALAQTRLAAEERRYAAHATAELSLPKRGMVWKLGASNGERIGAGETVAQVIDCEAPFIVASIPQRDFSLIDLGSMAQFRLSGEKTDREGHILSVTGDASVTGDRNLAAAPLLEKAATGVVRIDLPPSGNSGAECLVGRTARVLLPVSGGGPLERLMRWIK